MRKLILALTVPLAACAFALPAHACFYDLIIDPADVEIGSTVNIPVIINSLGYGDYDFDIHITTSPYSLSIVSIQPGAGLAAYLEANGTPGAYSMTSTPGSAHVDIWLDYSMPLYESTVYGEEFLIVKCEVTAANPGMTWISGSGPWFDNFTTPVTLTQPPEDPFVRGDVNLDTSANVIDVVNLLLYIFAGGAAPECHDAGDLDDNGVIGIADAVRLLHDIFGPTQSLPPGCGPDPTTDDLPDCSYPSCP